ncbi:MAG: DeoR/GlpR family DNA-binding transcription regulator [Cetobacterium sp.]
MFVEERKQKILNILKQKEKVNVNELSEFFSVSKVIIRKDLCDLEDENLLTRTHGGAILKKQIIQNSILKNLSKIELDEKLQMAQKSLSVIGEGDIIFLDNDDVNLITAELLSKKKINLTIISNSLEIQKIILKNKDINLVSIGGIYNSKTKTFVGDIARMNLEMFNTNKIFLGVDGINVDNLQISSSSIDYGVIKKSAIEMAASVYILASSQKFLQDSIFNFSKLNSNMTIITDDNLSTETKKILVEKNINILI